MPVQTIDVFEATPLTCGSPAIMVKSKSCCLRENPASKRSIAFGISLRCPLLEAGERIFLPHEVQSNDLRSVGGVEMTAARVTDRLAQGVEIIGLGEDGMTEGTAT